jgi:hypothetical protein
MDVIVQRRPDSNREAFREMESGAIEPGSVTRYDDPDHDGTERPERREQREP